MTDPVFEGNTDDLIAAMQQDEIVGATKMTPRDYAKLRGMTPQNVYYHLRKKNGLTSDWCDCGRRVIVVVEADEYFGIEDNAPDTRASKD